MDFYGNIISKECQNRLKIKSVQETDAGNYTCRLTYGSKHLYRSINLSVEVSIKWIDFPTEQQAVIGEEFIVKCIVKAQAHDVLTVHWFKDGIDIREKNRWAPKVSLGTQKLSLLLFADDIALVANKPQDLQTLLNLIEEYLHIKKLRLNTEKSEVVIFKKRKVGDDEKYTFKFNNKELFISKRIKYLGFILSENGSLRSHVDEIIKRDTYQSQYLPQGNGLFIRNVSREDAGIFTCRAKVELTADFSEKQISLKIIVPPKFKNVIEDIESIEDMSARLDCEAEGEPTPTYEFLDANDEPIIGRPGFVINPNTGILVIEEVKRENAGEYKCRASSDGRTIEAVRRLRVISKPTIVSFINATGVRTLLPFSPSIKETCTVSFIQ
ncbi:hypothetical protein QYM36_014999 [Artemia franciscana]|uniref:Ig-like domain-containing protein n=1 Tax=Artemia franciscana TaxID=6661 RepID=A0AA88HLQ8_ARTSF|nr:hypothetical protein QYM36_014999 [Artemia franciscana]